MKISEKLSALYRVLLWINLQQVRIIALKVLFVLFTYIYKHIGYNQ